ncbi:MULTISPECIES: TRAP transporter small permease [unclassified Microbacterium]|uniref:TRAP transporter small permease n=1 Tax=unclassified Microbacterium TaxID=2609290 RepID=UPI00214C6163|nr:MULTISPECIES: TRAP transporter small permease [unclassified Microbacterium]MCR2811372.1 TRAP transporter small permease [Microbacterium sp. zg.B185]WIM19582.1 TRAP transporter small permease [Microbacterium sp. zg-B185]
MPDIREGPSSQPLALSVFMRVEGVARGIMVAVAGASVVVLMLMTVADVGARTISGRSLSGVYEFTSIFLVVAAVGGMSLAERDEVHVRLSLVTDRLPRAVGAVCSIIGLALAVAVVLVLTYLNVGLAVDSFERNEVALGLARIPTWPAKAFIPIGLFVLALSLALTLIGEVRRLWGTAPTLERPDNLGGAI